MTTRVIITNGGPKDIVVIGVQGKVETNLATLTPMSTREQYVHLYQELRIKEVE